MVEPDSIAAAAAVDVKLSIWEDFVPSHDVTTIGAKL
jgi:hypothetical protein